jgi:hypothetical protein
LSASTDIGSHPFFAGKSQVGIGQIASTLLLLVSRYYVAIIVTGLVGLAAGWGVGTMLPKRYTSAVYLRLDENAARSTDALMSAAPVLDKVLAQVPVPGATVEQRRRRLDSERSLSVAPNEVARTSGLFQMQVADTDPARAKAIAAAFLDAWLEATKPTGDKKTQLEQQIARLERELAWTTEAIAQARKDPAAAATTAQGAGLIVLGSPMTMLVGKYEELVTSLEKTQQEAKGLSRDVILSEPTLPEEPSGPRKAPIMLGVALAAEALLLLWLFARQMRWIGPKRG